MMQIIDGPSELDQSIELHCDICIVGAGLSGIFLGRLLADAGLKVCLVEAGGKDSLDEQVMGFQADQSGMPYKAATVGRAFGLGGTGMRWGGVLAPYTKSDLKGSAKGQFDVWKHIVSTVEQNCASVLASIGFKQTPRFGPYFERVALGDEQSLSKQEGLDLVSAEVLPFRTRSFLKFLAGSKQSAGELLVYLRTVITSLEVDNYPNGDSVTRAANGLAGNYRVKVNANTFVLCAGAIETTRLLLEIAEAGNANGCRSGSGLGKYLGDHVSSAIAEIPAEDWTMTAKQFGPVFLNRKMRSFRMVERGLPTDSPRYFAHFIFEQENPGFILAKKILAGVQSQSIPDVSFLEFSDGVYGLTLLALNRFMRSRLYIPKATPVHLQLDIEQAPSELNRIQLGSEVDEFGRKKALIDWAIRDNDYKAIEETAQRIFSLWPKNEINLPRLHPIETGAVGNVHDAYHPVGTCRMGTDSDAVVNPDLRVHGNANLYVLSTAIFPTAGTANPTFSMLCFGGALAKTINSSMCNQDINQYAN